MKIMMIGGDPAKAVFQLRAALRTGQVQFRKRLTQKQFRAFGLPPIGPVFAQPTGAILHVRGIVSFAAGHSAHSWARAMEALGHKEKLIAP